MVFPVTVPILTLEIKETYLSDEEPTPTDGYEMVLVKDLGYTRARTSLMSKNLMNN